MQLPPDLKTLAPLLQRADETRAQEPIISYWCTYRAIHLGLAIKSDAPDPQRSRFLSGLIDALEVDKKTILATTPENARLLQDDEASAEYIKSFARKIFVAADDEDQAGLATRQTAKKFLAAANFLDLLRLFDKLDSELEGQQRYAKWKAGEISKTLRQAQQAAPEPTEGDSPTTSSLANEHTVANIIASGSAMGQSQPSPPTQESHTDYSHGSGMSPFGPASTAANPGYGDDHSRNSRPLASPNEWPPSALGQSPEIAGNGVAAAHPVVIQWNEGGREEEKVETISQKAVLQAQKHCRFAISSLDYEDIEQARKELRAALALLE